MNNLKIILYHPTINILSDRTFRELLKRLSSICRKVQSREVFSFVNNSFLDFNEKQSIADRIKKDLPHINSYYVENIERGSLAVTITVSAVALWLLQITVGHSLQEAWKKTRFHKELVKYLSSERRKEVIKRNIDVIQDGWIAKRFLIKNIQTEIDGEKDIVVRISLETPGIIEDRLKELEEKIDIDFIVANANKIIFRIEYLDD